MHHKTGHVNKRASEVFEGLPSYTLHFTKVLNNQNSGDQLLANCELAMNHFIEIICLLPSA